MLKELAPGARFFQGEQSVLLGGKLVVGGTDLVEQLCLLESVKRHGQCRWLADRETEPAARHGRRHHDLAALIADQAGRDDRMFRTDVLAGITGSRSGEM